MGNWGDVNAKEHSSADVKAKRVILYGYYSATPEWIAIAVDTDGKLVVTV